jgi:hypothetical protein
MSERTPDPFDRLYSKWAGLALERRDDVPSRERWDSAVLFLLLSEDPDRVARYRRVEANGPESLGSDAFELWSKLPNYMPNRNAPVRTQNDLRTYEILHRGAMQELMEARGLGERYSAIVAEQEEYELQRKAKARRGQTSVMIMGCAGMGAILIMMLTVLLIIGLQLTSK